LRRDRRTDGRAAARLDRVHAARGAFPAAGRGRARLVGGAAAAGNDALADDRGHRHRRRVAGLGRSARPRRGRRRRGLRRADVPLGFGANTGLVLSLVASPVLLVAVGLVARAFVAGRLSADLAGDTLTVADGPAILPSQRNIAAALLVARTGADDGDGSIVVAILLLSAVGFVMLVPYALLSGLVRRRRAGERTSLGVLLGVVGPKSD